VAEPELAAVQRRDRRGETKAEVRTRLTAARIQPYKPLHHVLAVAFGNSGAVVGDAEQNGVALAPRLDQDFLGRSDRLRIDRRTTGLPYLIAFSTRLASAWLINSRLPWSGLVPHISACCLMIRREPSRVNLPRERA
jgi:hypothetical protein